MFIPTHTSEADQHANTTAQLEEEEHSTPELSKEEFPVHGQRIRTPEQLNDFFVHNLDGIRRTAAAKSFRTPEESDDIAQDAYARMRTFLQHNPDGIAEPWAVLHTVTRNLAIDELRRSATRTRRFVPLYEDTFIPPTKPGAGTSRLDDSLPHLVLEAMSQLRENQFKVLTEIFFNGKRGRQVAHELGLSESYVAEIKSAAIAALRGILENREVAT